MNRAGQGPDGPSTSQETTAGARTFQAIVRDTEGRALLLGSLTLAYWLGHATIVVVHLLTLADAGDGWRRWVPYGMFLAAVVPTLVLALRWRARLPDFRQHPLPEVANLLSNATVSSAPLPPPPATFVVGGGGGSGLPSSERFAKLDYLKVFVNLLVIFKHGTFAFPQPPWDLRSRWLKNGLNLFCEPFIMQAMAFGSGFVFDPKPAKRRVEAIIRLTCGYFILQAGYLVLLKYLVLRRRPDDPEKSLHMENFYSDADDGKDRLSFVQMVSDLVYPFWQLWYLAAMVAWRILAPYWAHLRHPVTAAIILSTLDGFHSPYTYSTQRTTYYFPYFMLGVVIRQDGYAAPLMELASSGGAAGWAAGMGALQLVYAGIATWNWMPVEYFRGESGYAHLITSGGPDSNKLPNNYWVVMFARIASYAVGAALVLAALASMPSFESRVRRAGERTLGPYTLSFAVVLLVHSLTPLTDDQAWHHILPLQVILWSTTLVLFTPQAHAISRNVIMPPLGRLGFFPDSWEGDPEGTGGDDHDLRGAFAPWTPRSVGSTPRDVSLGEHA